MALSFERNGRARLAAILLAACAGSAAACSKSSAGAAAGSAPSASSVPSASGAASAAPAPSSRYAPPYERHAGTIASRLAEEAASRPTGTPTVEQVFGAFGKAGAPVHNIFQHLGSAVHARYCSAGAVDTGLIVSVCEYSDEAAAAAGKDETAKALASLKRDYYVNKKTVLSIQQMTKTPESEATAKKMAEAFEKL